MAVINRVKAFRHSLGLTQADLSSRVNVTRQTIISIEKGRLNPSILLCLRIAQALNCNVSQLFCLEMSTQNHSHVSGACAMANNAPLVRDA